MARASFRMAVMAALACGFMSRTLFAADATTTPAATASQRPPKESYSLRMTSPWGGSKTMAIELDDDYAVIRCDDGNGRTREGQANAAAAKEFADWIATKAVDRLGDYRNSGILDGTTYYYDHFSREGGGHFASIYAPPSVAAKRGELATPSATPVSPAEIYGQLVSRFEELVNATAMPARYEKLEKLPTFKVVHQEENGAIERLFWSDGRLLARLRKDDNSHPVREVTENGLGREVNLPPEPEKDSHYFADYVIAEGPLSGQHLLVTGVRSPIPTDEHPTPEAMGLLLRRGNETPEEIGRGLYANVIIFWPGGEWIVISKTAEGKFFGSPHGVMRIHLPSKREESVSLPAAEYFEPLAYLEAHHAVLLGHHRREEHDAQASPTKYYLLNATTGATKEVRGDFRPLYRGILDAPARLQAARQRNCLWATLEDGNDTQIGLYDTGEFRFREVTRLPSTSVGRESMWVDEEQRVIWLELNADIVRFALPAP
jgi:hypothetical protein